jgi:protein-L-isoaspartate(D-aspartate) O-methyltransferase
MTRAPAPPGRPRFPLSLDSLDKPVRGGPAVAPRTPAKQPLMRPQQLLQQAADDAMRRVAPAGLGLDSPGVRQRMVDTLQQAGLRDAAVLQALSSVPRHLFVDPGLANQAYEDTSLPIGWGQTISKPSVVGHMLELLMAGESARARRSLGNVLEIGTGCGYQAAVLAGLSRQVLSVERLKPLHDKARDLLRSLHLPSIRLVYGDGMRGHPPNAPYDSIIAAAGGETLPPAWLEQLAVGGRLVAPVHDASGTRQVLMVVDKTENGSVHVVHDVVKFVPLKSGLD